MEQIVASLSIPFIFIVKEIVRISSSYTLLEPLYYFLSPLAVGIILIFYRGTDLKSASLLPLRCRYFFHPPFASFYF